MEFRIERLATINCYGTIFLYTVKLCHSDWFNKNPNGHQLGGFPGSKDAEKKEEMPANTEQAGWAVWR